MAGQGVQISIDCLLDGEEGAMRSTIAGVRNGMFQLLCPKALKPDQQLTLRHAKRSIRSRVVYCKANATGGYAAGLVMASDAERRAEVRTPVSLNATLRVGGSPSTTPVRVVDVSDSGLGLELSSAIAVGASVHVELSTGAAIGEMRHCAKRGDVYRAGIRICEFALAPNRARLVVLDARFESAGERAVASLTRAVQERQFRYEAIFYSLAEPLKLSRGA
jgi:PilZ domain